MIKSRICEMLGIKYPVFQGGMAWVADASLAAAVSNAGGLGLISSINAGTDTFAQILKEPYQIAFQAVVGRSPLSGCRSG